MAQDAEVKFWWIPELVEHLLMFMDPASILNLAHSHSLVEQVLQSASVWTGLIKRVCSFDREEQDFPPTNLIIQRKCGQVRALVGLLELLQNSENQQLELLELIQLRFSIQDDLCRSQCVSLCDPMIGPAYHVSPLGFLLIGGRLCYGDLGGQTGGALDLCSQLKGRLSAGAGGHPSNWHSFVQQQH